jgi:sulfide:quinone oxidoreductase
MHRIVILGGGTGGTLSANRLRKIYPTSEASITVVDENDNHVYQPGLLFVPFGLSHREDIVRPRGRQLHDGIDYLTTGVDKVNLEVQSVTLNDGTEIGYDVLVVATGTVISPEETEGLTGAGWMEKVFTFYTPEGAEALEKALATFTSGRIVVNVVEMPIKCPVAPLEFCFLADWFFRERGLRDSVDITYVTPLDAAFTKPVAAKQLGGMFTSRNINLVTEFNTGEVDGAQGRLVSYDGQEVPFDLAVVIPVHSGAPCILRSEGLGDELGFVATDPHTLQTKASPNVFALGDATSLPTSKAGSVTDFEGGILVENIRRFLAGQSLHRDGLRQGDADRLQLRRRTAARPLPGQCRFAALERVAPQPPGQVGVPVDLLAQPAARSRHSRHPQRHAHQGQEVHQDKGRSVMSIDTIAGATIELNEEGFMTDSSQWNEDVAVELARREGIEPLTERHWVVIHFMRKEFFEKGTGPTVRMLGKTSGVSVKELYELFPKGPAKLAAKIAGIPKPRGCI